VPRPENDERMNRGCACPTLLALREFCSARRGLNGRQVPDLFTARYLPSTADELRAVRVLPSQQEVLISLPGKVERVAIAVTVTEDQPEKGDKCERLFPIFGESRRVLPTCEECAPAEANVCASV
jgi:hypothetical protein